MSEVFIILNMSERVVLHGLKAVAYNGRTGVITGPINNGRVPVNLGEKVLSLKPINLRSIDAIIVRLTNETVNRSKHIVHHCCSSLSPRFVCIFTLTGMFICIHCI